MIASDVLINRRQLRRHKLSVEIAIIDRLKLEPIGKLVDIHQDGLLMLGRSLIIDSAHQLLLVLPNSINCQTYLDLEVECLWSQTSANDDTLYWVGFRIIDKSRNASASIQSLINITSQ
jgi:hypothetical protein